MWDSISHVGLICAILREYTPCFFSLQDIPSGYVKIAIENGEFSHSKWCFSILMLVYQWIIQVDNLDISGSEPGGLSPSSGDEYTIGGMPCQFQRKPVERGHGSPPTGWYVKIAMG